MTVDASVGFHSLGCGELFHGPRLRPFGRGSSLRLAPVAFERFPQCVLKSGQRQIAVGRRSVSTAEAAIDFLMAVHEERGPSQIVIEIKYVQVHAAHVRNAEQDELLGEGSNFFVETNNLLVKPLAVGSPLSPEHDEQRLILAQGLGPGLSRVLQPDRTLGSVCRLP